MRSSTKGLVTHDIQTRWIAYAAALWALLFAGLSFYWGLGGRRGATTLGPAIMAAAADPWFVAIGLWGVGGVKVIGVLIALALIRPWPQPMLHRLLRGAAYAGGGLALLYGAASFVQHALMVTGVIRLPEGLGPAAARWHLLLWDPWWMVGGILFIATARLVGPVNSKR